MNMARLLREFYECAKKCDKEEEVDTCILLHEVKVYSELDYEKAQLVARIEDLQQQLNTCISMSYGDKY